jgi:hypothetical protein
VTSAEPVESSTPRPRRCRVAESITVLHGSSASTPETSTSESGSEIVASDSVDITLDVGRRRRLGLLTGVVATLIAAAILLTLSLVQRHSRASASATPITLPAPTGS